MLDFGFNNFKKANRVPRTWHLDFSAMFTAVDYSNGAWKLMNGETA
jgi:hypothetical protein